MAVAFVFLVSWSIPVVNWLPRITVQDQYIFFPWSIEPESPRDTEEIKKTWSDINRRIRKKSTFCTHIFAYIGIISVGWTKKQPQPIHMHLLSLKYERLVKRMPLWLLGVGESKLEKGIDIVAGSHLPHNLNTKLSILTGEKIKVSVYPKYRTLANVMSGPQKCIIFRRVSLFNMI